MPSLLPADPAARRRRDRVLIVLFVLALVVLVARAARKDAGVLAVNQSFGERCLAGVDPYRDVDLGERVHGPYPPSYALICAPLALLPTTAARVVWAIAQCGALVLLLALLRRRLRLHAPELAPHATVVAACALLLVSRYLLRDMAAGGGNLLYGALAVAGLELVLAGRERAAGPAIAFGLAVKPNLAPMLLFYAARRRWSAIAATAAAGVLLVLLPALLFGLETYAELWRRWTSDVLAYAGLADLHAVERIPPGFPEPKNAMNQSLRVACFRLFRPPAPGGGPDVHVVALSAAAAAWVGRGATLALVGWAVLAAWRARGAAAVWLAGLCTLGVAVVVSPIAWKAHSVALLPLAYALVACALRERRRGLAALLVVYYLACNLLSEELTGKDAKAWLQAASIVTWGNVALLVAGFRQTARLSRGGSRPA